MTEDLGSQKADLRQRMTEVRRQIPAAVREDAAASIATTLAHMLGDASTVMAFLSFGSELPTDGIVERLHHAGHAIALPHVDGDAVVPVAYAPGDSLREAAFGIREPETLTPLDPSAIDAVVVPGLAFDPRGYRIGYGGGFYDRLLPTLREDAVRIGIGFDAQVVDAVPVDPFDIPVHVIVTELRTIQISPEPSR